MTGLTTKEALDQQKIHGENVLATEKKARPIGLFFGQFKDVMVIILLIATVVSVALGEVYDAITIILIVLVNAILGFIQEYRTEKTLEALSKMTAPTSRCYRDNTLQIIQAKDLVNGDIIELEAGDLVPADCELLSSRGLFSDESILTGEAVPVEKSVGSRGGSDNSAGKSSVVYCGASITKGNAQGKVIATGMNSQMGKISGMLSDIKVELTPLQIRLAELGKIVAVICLVVCIVVFAAGVLRGEPIFEMLLTGISIAIAAIPEGLPATVTIALALAVNRMLRQKALVNKLHSVETLGCTSVICSDKTGTITENKMTVVKVIALDMEYDISGLGYKIAGEVKLNNNRINPISVPTLRELFISAVLCNNAVINSKAEISSRDRGKLSVAGEWSVIGDPTELALLVAAAKGGVTANGIASDYKKLDEIPFDSETRCMTVLISTKSGEKIAYIKGALDVILAKCSYIETSNGVVALTSAIRRDILGRNDVMANSALRVLAFAKKSTASSNDIHNGMIFLGLMGMQDPARPEVKRAIKLCKSASIKTVMITGDHKNTAIAVAKQAGILVRDTNENVLTGAELSNMSDEQLIDVIEKISVFARVNPDHKLRIVKAFKHHGHIVTMTGDGVNDAPAIKEANIGVAMGITGTDVTKQAADVILLDDNFATLVNAVEQGRNIYANIRKFVRYLLSCNIGEVITMFLGIIMGMPLILLPTQILLVNLVTDGLPAIALGVEPVDDNLMAHKPRSGNESFFANGLMAKIVFRGIMIGLSTLGSFVAITGIGGDINAARTAALFTLVVSQLIHVFECKSEVKNIFTVPFMNNPRLILAVLVSVAVIVAAIYYAPLQLIFGTVPLDTQQLLIASTFSVTIPILNSIAMLFTAKN